MWTQLGKYSYFLWDWQNSVQAPSALDLLTAFRQIYQLKTLHQGKNMWPLWKRTCNFLGKLKIQSSNVISAYNQRNWNQCEEETNALTCSCDTIQNSLDVAMSKCLLSVNEQKIWCIHAIEYSQLLKRRIFCHLWQISWSYFCVWNRTELNSWRTVWWQPEMDGVKSTRKGKSFN